MKTKKLFMLLLALIGVTGVWAERISGHYDFKYQERVWGPGVSSSNLAAPAFDALRIKSNNYVKVTLELRRVIPAVESLESVEGCLIDADNLLIESLDPDHVTITKVTILTSSNTQTCEVNGTSWSRRDGQQVHLNNVSSISVNYTIEHTHVPSQEWMYDNHGHWHVCEGYGGLCPMPDNEIDWDSHSYNRDLNNDATAYTCCICGYVNQSIKEKYDALDNLSMKAVGGNATIGMAKTGNPANYDLMYSFDKVHWAPVTLTATNPDMVEIPSGQTCYFRHGATTAIDGISTSENDYWTFTMTGTGTIEAGGNIMSLLDINCTKTNVGSFAFANLFKGCDMLTKAPLLPATSLAERCYKGMFEGTRIVEAPALGATQVANGAYQAMFKNCQYLTKAPNLVSTRVDNAGYQDMFNGCKKITAITLAEITTIENANAFSNWLAGTAEGTEGIITAPDAMVGKSEIMSNLPSNWMFKQIKDYITAINEAMEGAADIIKGIGADYIEQIKSATSNDVALNLRDEALNGINLLKKYNSQIVDGQFVQPTGAGMRLKITMNNDVVYEFNTQDIKRTEYYRATE